MIPDKKYPKITVVTPNYNQAKFIEVTIQSVLNQNYPNLEYIIIDGASTDGSIDIIKKYENELEFWISEPDKGMYYAINKGFDKSTGDIMCWINSDDILQENALINVARFFNENRYIKWLQGYPNVIDEEGTLIYERNQIFSKYYFYWKKHETSLAFVQQESTFWTRDLWEKAAGNLDTNYKLAADFDLWVRFFEKEKMYCTNLKLGAFRKRKGQKSSDIDSYIDEVRISLSRNFKKLGMVDRLIINLGCKLEKINMPLIRKVKAKFQSLIIGRLTFVNLKN